MSHGSFDGAIRSGLRAAEEILRGARQPSGERVVLAEAAPHLGQ